MSEWKLGLGEWAMIILLLSYTDPSQWRGTLLWAVGIFALTVMVRMQKMDGYRHENES